MPESRRGICLLASIVERGQAKGLMNFYMKNNIVCHYQCFGRGTAPSELLDILGLGGTQRDVLLSLGAAEEIAALVERLREDVPVAAKGIAFSTRLSAVTASLGAALLTGQAQSGMKGELRMEQERHNSLILIVANRGFTEDVMHTARAAGARGGTTIRARLAGFEDAAGLYGEALQEEKEIIAIVATRDSRGVIMEAIHRSHGPESPAGAVVCAIGLEDMVRLS